MRTIKFRGKIAFGGYDGGNGWIYGNLTESPTHPYIQEVKDLGNDWYHLPRTEVVPKSIGQFTGLHDKNGKEIYEGDIVRFPTSVNEGKYRSIGYIGFHQLSASFRIITKSSDLGLGNRCGVHEMTIEVIGNIYDNPELLQHN